MVLRVGGPPVLLHFTRSSSEARSEGRRRKKEGKERKGKKKKGKEISEKQGRAENTKISGLFLALTVNSWLIFQTFCWVF